MMYCRLSLFLIYNWGPKQREHNLCSFTWIGREHTRLTSAQKVTLLAAGSFYFHDLEPERHRSIQKLD